MLRDVNIMLARIGRELRQGKTLITFTSIRALGETLGMVAPLIVAKFFSPGLFASYSLARMVVFFFAALLISSSQVPFIIFANQEKLARGRINKTFSVQLTFLILSLFLFAAMSLLLGRYIMAFAGINRGDLFFVQLAFVGFVLKTFLCNLFMAMGQRIKNSLAELAFSGFTLCLVFVLHLTDRLSLRTVFLIYFTSALLVVFIFIKTIDFGPLRPFIIDKRHFSDILDCVKWIMLATTAVYFVNWGDNLVLRCFVSMQNIGTYNLAYQAFKGVLMLSFIIDAYFLPFISQHVSDAAKMRVYLSEKRPKIFLFGLLGIGLLFVVLPRIFRIYGDAYRDSIMLLRILLIGSVPMLYTVFYTPIFSALKEYKFLQIACMLQVLLNIILDLLLVPPMGPPGAAIATVVAYFCLAAIIEVYYRVKLKKMLGL